MALYIIRRYHDFPFEIVEHDPKNKMFGNQRVSSVLHAPYTDKRWEEVQEFNQKLEAFKEFGRQFNQKIRTELGFN